MEMVKMLEMLKTALRRGHKKRTEAAGGQEGGQVVEATAVSINGHTATPSYACLGSDKKGQVSPTLLLVITCIVNADKQWMALR